MAAVAPYAGISIDTDKGETVVDMDKLRMVSLVISSAAIATTSRGGSPRYTLNALEKVAGDDLGWTRGVRR